MQLNYLMLGLVSFFGLVAGMIIALMAKEELKPGKKYFLIMQKAVLALMLALLVTSTQLSMTVKIAAAIIAIALLLIGKSIITYPFLAAALWLSTTTTMATLIFIYGLPTAALLSEENIKKSKTVMATQLLVRHMPFLIATTVLSFI